MADPLWILVIGMVVVVGGVLVLKLHAFLALILGAIIVGSLTSPSSIEQHVRQTRKQQQEKMVQDNKSPAEIQAFAQLTPTEAKRAAQQTIGERIAIGFGNTCMSIGILIGMASIIGKCLLDSGAADRIVRSTLRLLGEARAAVSFLGSGFLLGIPVFFDTVFYLMIPLGKALYLRTGRNYLLYVLTIAAGATMAHSLVPPTPGPLFVASALGVDMGTMILAGCVVGLFTISAGYGFAVFANRLMEVPVRETQDISAEELHDLSQRDESQLPPLWLSLLPIILPVILIGGSTVVNTLLQGEALREAPEWQQQAQQLINAVGNQNIALILAAAVALATLAWQRRASREELARAVQAALASAGVIILITAAGGAFGRTLQQTGIGGRIEELSSAYQIGLIPLAFLVTMLIRTAQGSATVAMITAVGVVAGMSSLGQLSFNPVYIALAIGCGSKPISWMNDSGFWVICKMSGMTETETLKTITPMLAIMGVVGLVVVMIGAALFPLV
ncbi:MAG: GntP family permease [Gemmataceae bacterium]